MLHKLVNISLICLSVLSVSCLSKPQKTPGTKKTVEIPKSKDVPVGYIRFMAEIEPFFEKMEEPEKGEWLDSFTEEGQTFGQYLALRDKSIPNEKRSVLYIRPYGDLSQEQTKNVQKAARFLSSFFGVVVEILPVLRVDEPLRIKNFRSRDETQNRQIRSGYILDDVLKPSLPDDAAALIAFTNEDLYPSESFNYVFGQASLRNRVGVWSFFRLKDKSDKGNELRRIIKLAVHETGHMFSINHCVFYSCAINGANHLAEADKRPLDFCPEDTSKVLWFSGQDPEKRYRQLSKLSEEFGLVKEAKVFNVKADAVKNRSLPKIGN